MDEDEHILPTAALYAEAIPGECCACEENIVRREDARAEAAELENELLEAERDRRQGEAEGEGPERSHDDRAAARRAGGRTPPRTTLIDVDGGNQRQADERAWWSQPRAAGHAAPPTG